MSLSVYPDEQFHPDTSPDVGPHQRESSFRFGLTYWKGLARYYTHATEVDTCLRTAGPGYFILGHPSLRMDSFPELSQHYPIPGEPISDPIFTNLLAATRGLDVCSRDFQYWFLTGF